MVMSILLRNKRFQMNNTKKIINKIKELKGIKKNKELAKSLDIKYDRLNSWIKRDTIPFEIIKQIVEEHKITYDYLLTGEGNTLKKEEVIPEIEIHSNEKVKINIKGNIIINNR